MFLPGVLPIDVLQLDGFDRDIAGLYDRLHKRSHPAENATRFGTAISHSLCAVYSYCRGNYLFWPDALFAFGHVDPSGRVVGGRDGYLFRL